jgi:hypothetical protein
MRPSETLNCSAYKNESSASYQSQHNCFFRRFLCFFFPLILLLFIYSFFFFIVYVYEWFGFVEVIGTQMWYSQWWSKRWRVWWNFHSKQLWGQTRHLSERIPHFHSYYLCFDFLFWNFVVIYMLAIWWLIYCHMMFYMIKKILLLILSAIIIFNCSHYKFLWVLNNQITYYKLEQSFKSLFIFCPKNKCW